jgi:hypothetical protein
LRATACSFGNESLKIRREMSTERAIYMRTAHQSLTIFNCAVWAPKNCTFGSGWSRKGATKPQASNLFCTSKSSHWNRRWSSMEACPVNDSLMSLDNARVNTNPGRNCQTTLTKAACLISSCDSTGRKDGWAIVISYKKERRNPQRSEPLCCKGAENLLDWSRDGATP